MTVAVDERDGEWQPSLYVIGGGSRVCCPFVRKELVLFCLLSGLGKGLECAGFLCMLMSSIASWTGLGLCCCTVSVQMYKYQ